MPSPVVVNFNVSVDASGSVSVFGEEPHEITNKIVATKSLPVTALYDASGSSNSNVLNSLFEFWEGSDSTDIQGTLSGKTVSGNSSVSQGRDYTKLLPKFVMDLQAVLDAPFDCSGATPFNQYTSTSQYYKPDNFGRLALSSYAHYLFGHVAATAAITNDVSFMNAMLSKTSPNITSTTATYPFTSASPVSVSDISGSTASATNANLALRLVKEIMTLSDSKVTDIVKQVIGQDASRAKDQDNNDLQPGVRQALKFVAGDKIYMNIQLQQPNVVVNGNGNAPNKTDVIVGETNYTLEIILEDTYTEIHNISKIIADWAITLDGPSSDIGNSVTIDSTGNIYITGYYVSPFTEIPLKDVSGNTQIDSLITLPPTNSSAAFIVKYNSNGICQWATNIDSNNPDIGLSIDCDVNNNIYVTGSYTSSIEVILKDVNGNTQIDSLITLPPSLNSAAFIAKYNSNGICQWATNIDGLASDRGYSVTTDSTGNIYLTGQYASASVVALKDVSGNTQIDSSISLPNTSSFAIFIIKYNSNGICQWATNIDGTGSGEQGNSVITDSIGNLYVTGSYDSNYNIILKDVSGNTQSNSLITLPRSFNNAAFISKYNSNGICQWATYIDYDGNNQDSGYSITIDISNNIYITGQYTTNQSDLILKDVSGNTQIDSLIILPNTYDKTSVFIIKYNTNGICQWATYLHGDFNCVGYSIASDISNNIYITGSYMSQDDIILKDVSGNIQTDSSIILPSKYFSSSFVLKYNSSGIAQSATYLDGDYINIGRGIITDINKNIYLIGNYTILSSLITVKNFDNNIYQDSSIILPNISNSAKYLIKYIQ